MNGVTDKQDVDNEDDDDGDECCSLRCVQGVN